MNPARRPSSKRICCSAILERPYDARYYPTSLEVRNGRAGAPRSAVVGSPPTKQAQAPIGPYGETPHDPTRSEQRGASVREGAEVETLSAGGRGRSLAAPHGRAGVP